MGIIKQIKDSLGNLVYPITKTKAVYDDEGNRLDNVLALRSNKIIGSDEWDVDISYKVGDMLIWGDVAYEVIVACKGVEPPNKTYYKEVTLTSLNTNLANLMDVVSNENGIAIKYANGIMICTKTVSQVCTYTAWGSWYESTIVELGNFPIPFTQMPNIQATLVNCNGNVTLGQIGSATNTSCGSVKTYRPTTTSAISVNVSITAIGFWK